MDSQGKGSEVMWSATPELKKIGYLLHLSQHEIHVAAQYNIVPDLHVEDYVFNALYSHSYAKEFDKAFDAYCQSGRVSAVNIADIINRHLEPSRSGHPITFLDFASGYGCVSRHFRNVFPGSPVVAMDIHDHAFYFNTGHLKIDAAISHTVPANVAIFSRFDVVFALSFFSHMPRATQLLWLDKLTEFVKPGGLLIFTTHGETSHKKHMPHIVVDGDGYGFIAESEQFDLSTSDYGHAVTYKNFTLEMINQLGGVNLVEFREAFWWTHQDTYVLRKQAIISR
jgi:2-polyprenyl-3-methyl-5-hydroxy-6-metoxy-1,4-benzoquinol methylase